MEWKSCQGQQSSAGSAPRLGLNPRDAQQRSLRTVGLGILESLSGPVATVPLSAPMLPVPPHGSRGNVNPSAPKVRHDSHRQVKDNFINRVVEKCGPAVVRIQTEQKVEVPAFTNLCVCFRFYSVLQYLFVNVALSQTTCVS